MNYRDWLTNCPEAAEELRAADQAYQQERANAAHLPLEQKVISYRCARKRLAQNYDRIFASYGVSLSSPRGE